MVHCHDVLDFTVKQAVDAPSDQRVPEIVEGPFILREIGGGQTVSDHHVGIFIQDKIHHFRSVLHGIGIVSVHHDIALRINFTEHPPDDISLALHVLISHNRPGGFCKLRRPVRGIVVVHVNHCFRQSSLRVCHHLGNGFLFVVARNQNRNLIHFHPLFFFRHPPELLPDKF